MKGTNVLKLNNATVIEALQLWVDKYFGQPLPTVTGVEVDTSARTYISGGTLELMVTLVGDDND